MIHLLQISDPQNPAIGDCLQSANDSDLVVLISTIQAENAENLLQPFLNKGVTCNILPLSDDSRNPGNVDRIDYLELTKLSCQHTKILSWF